MGHAIKECNVIKMNVKELPEHELLYSLALKAESTLMGKESLKFGVSTKKSLQ